MCYLEIQLALIWTFIHKLLNDTKMVFDNWPHFIQMASNCKRSDFSCAHMHMKMNSEYFIFKFFTSILFISCKNSFLHNFQKHRCTQRLLRTNNIYVVILDLRSVRAWHQWILKLHVWIVWHLKGHMWLQIWPIWDLWWNEA